MNKILLFIALSYLLAQRAYSGDIIKLEEFSYTENQISLAQEILTILEEDHFLKKNFNSIWEEALDVYLERLDPNKNIFLSEELN